jgi:aminoglycoside N3'-acetyltransferase
LACIGPQAKELIAGHDDCDTPCGAASPYQKLVDWDASVLMFGATLNAYTLFHTAEDAAGVPYLYEPNTYELRLREPDGSTRHFRMHRQDMSVSRRFAEMSSWLEDRGLLVRQRCGNGELLWLPHAGGVHEAVTKALRDDPWLLVSPESRPVSLKTAYETSAA